jgi:glucosamine--fructose-6-phosphate aminotransferase (isomerizing)
MCGIIGVLGPLDDRDGDLPGALAAARTELREALTALSDDGGAGPAAVARRVASLAALLEPAVGFAGSFAFGQAPALATAAADVAGELAALQRLVAARAESAADFDGREAWNRVHVAVLDLAWRLEEDARTAWRALERYRPTPWAAADRRLLAALWRVELVLRALDRLEIRGRDSAGLAVVIAFPDASAHAVWRAALAGGPLEPALLERERRPGLDHGAVAGSLRPDARALAFVYKVAAEVGRMGDNVAALRAALAEDGLLLSALAAAGVGVSVLAHTRWASNGIVNRANAHPQADLHEDEPAGRTGVLAVLNGDVDNYPGLRAAYEARTGRRLPAGVTTDASIIPFLLAERAAAGAPTEPAFRETLAGFDGSFAVAALHLDAPERLLLGVGGSGQSLHVGLAPSAEGPVFVVSSEVYGLVEATARYVRLDGERERVPGDPTTRGQVYALDAQGGFVARSLDGALLDDAAQRQRTAGITTRDIHIGGFPHFFLKEISQGVASVEKTVRGLLHAGDTPAALHFRIDERVVPQAVVQALAEGHVRRVLCIGQGTAAVAAAGVATALRAVLDPDVPVEAHPATEVSGHRLRPEMGDTLVVAVSQSGTTADTNRTVDLLRARGARVLSIINRRDSDLVHKSDGVLYTSDGRDVEMSVASTKAFYAQLAAGNVLALYLAHATGRLDAGALHARARELFALPARMAAVLAQSDAIAAVAERILLGRRHWAVVGSGPNRIAAAEVRIKLSELCYKAIALDHLEDKKHIDLSSEPAIVVCAAGLDEPNLADSVKEVAIFRAHRSLPLVLTDAPPERFAPYAADVIPVPAVAPALSPVVVAMAGHLLGYHAAAAIERHATRLKRLRAALLPLLAEPGREDGDADAWRAVQREAAGFVAELVGGRVDAALEAGGAARLVVLLQNVLPGEAPASAAASVLAARSLGTPGATLLDELTRAIGELSRPIDAIKHQAKTVTVGISRAEAPLVGPLADALREAALDPAALPWPWLARLRALAPLVREVAGMTTYAVDDLEAGQPLPTSRIRKLAATGVAASIPSRTERDQSLTGTKWLALLRREVVVARGRRDGRLIAALPDVAAGAPKGRLLLLHLVADEAARRAARVAWLATRSGRLDELRAAVTESGGAWSDALLESVPVAALLAGEPEALTAALLAAARAAG